MHKRRQIHIVNNTQVTTQRVSHTCIQTQQQINKFTTHLTDIDWILLATKAVGYEFYIFANLTYFSI